MEEFFNRLNNFHKKYSRYFLMLLLIVSVILLFKITPILITLFLPFILGWGISLLASPITKFLHRKLHLPNRVGGIFTVLLLIGLLSLIISLIVSWATDIVDYVGNNWNEIVTAAARYVNSAYQGILEFSQKLPFEVSKFFENENFVEAFSLVDESGNVKSGYIEEITSVIKPLAGSVASGTINVVKSLPEIIIFITILVLATYFITSHRSNFIKWYSENMSERFQKNMYALRKECFGALWGTVRAQVLLTMITMVELLIGFSILGIENATILAVVISIVDMLPILGVGTVIIPWAIINFFAGGEGHISISVGLISLYFICFAVRNLIQPKIIGKSMGIGPITSLVAIWLGFRLYGFLGMLIMPAVATVLYKIYDIGLFDWFFLSHKKVTEERERLAAEKAENGKKAEAAEKKEDNKQ